MTLHNLVAYIFIALIGVQSIVAVADAHQMHQVGTEHIEWNQNFDNHDQWQASQQFYNSEQIEHIDSHHLDCQHCCHCHWHSSMIYLGNSLALSQISSLTLSFPITIGASSAYPQSLLRPPIS